MQVVGPSLFSSVARASRSRGFLRAAVGAALVGLGGCGSGLDASSPAFKAGELGNGGFSFTCDDSVACNKYNAAAQFPEAVAQGATFRVRFVPRDASSTSAGSGAGITVSPVGKDFVTVGTDGLSGGRTGTGIITARNAKGALVEFTPIKIEKADAIAVYDGEYVGNNPVTLDRVTMRLNERKTLRALARRSGRDLAGLLRYEWSVAGGAVAVGRVTDGKVTLDAKSVGNAVVTVAGGAFKQEFSVEVTQ